MQKNKNIRFLLLVLEIPSVKKANIFLPIWKYFCLLEF